MIPNSEQWPKDLPNPTWHDHFYGATHSPLFDEEHHEAVDALLRYIHHLQLGTERAEIRGALDGMRWVANNMELYGTKEWRGYFLAAMDDVETARAALARLGF